MKAALNERIVRHLQLTGAWEQARAQLEFDDAVRAAARQDGVIVEIEALQAGVDRFREQLGLDSVDATLGWLAQARITLEDVETEVEARILEDTLCDRLHQREMEEAFRKQRIRFDAVRLCVFSVGDAATAGALASQWRDTRGPGHDLGALGYDLGARMEWGWFWREELPERAAMRIFKALPGALVGPLQVDDGRHAVYGVEAFRAATLDADIEWQLRRELMVDRIRLTLQPHDPGRLILK